MGGHFWLRKWHSNGCARRGVVGIILGEGPKGVDGVGAEEGVREAENYYAPSFRPCCPLIPFARRVGKVHISALWESKFK